MSEVLEAAETHCAFCHRHRTDVNYLVATDDATTSICDACVETARDIIGTARMDDAGRKVRRVPLPNEEKTDEIS